MIKVGITGNIASGKSKVEEYIKEKSFNVIDADEISHKLLNDAVVKNQIITEFFGYDILEDGNVSRQKIGKVVFQNELLRKKLENIIHPRVKIEIGRFFRAQEERGEKIAFASVPLLFESKFEDIFDNIILVYADDLIRLERLIKRNNLTVEQAKSRLAIQMNQDEKIKLSDYLIYNNKSINELHKKIDEIFNLLI